MFDFLQLRCPHFFNSWTYLFNALVLSWRSSRSYLGRSVLIMQLTSVYSSIWYKFWCLRSLIQVDEARIETPICDSLEVWSIFKQSQGLKTLSNLVPFMIQDDPTGHAVQ